jgi:uncharacterized damage-inducible protein DinB
MEEHMSEITRIVEQLEQAHQGGAWHGPSVAEALEGVSAAGASRKPIGAAHSIWEIVNHVRATDEVVRRRVSGEAPRDEEDWPAPSGQGDAGWRAAVDQLKATQRALREAVSKLPERRLHENIPGQDHSYWYGLHGIVHHDLYHAGQISLLKKGL